MKHVVWFGLLLGGAVVVLGPGAGLSADEKKGGGPPPLSLEGFLDEKLPEAKPKPAGHKEILADNQACHVCHENYKEEPLALTHAIEDVGCIDCHGDSVDHRNDENNIIPPDVMFARAEVEDTCKECHDRTHKAPPRELIRCWQERCAGVNVAEVNCTDCHFDHRLKSRTVVWDKMTGKLLTQK